ncbi:MAG TPA: hypothetical protein VFJ43_15735 [Bacteroidia bacterium]|nr:hypothetical protein [Bacteroidia bacterium]
MFPFLLLSFIPAIRNTVVKHFLGEDVHAKDMKTLSKKLYAQIPGVSKIVDENDFVDFCLQHKDKIFPPKKKTVAKKTTAKPRKTVRPVKKAAAKKKTVKK